MAKEEVFAVTARDDETVHVAGWSIDGTQYQFNVSPLTVLRMVRGLRDVLDDKVYTVFWANLYVEDLIEKHSCECESCMDNRIP